MFKHKTRYGILGCVLAMCLMAQGVDAAGAQQIETRAMAEKQKSKTRNGVRISVQQNAQTMMPRKIGGDEEATYAVLRPISKYLQQGDMQSLSSWLDRRLELSIYRGYKEMSREQAVKILEDFFKDRHDNNVRVLHKMSRGTLKQIILQMESGSETFEIHMFISQNSGNHFLIRQLRIIEKSI